MNEKICLKGNILEIEIRVIIFQDEGLWFFSSPSLQLNAYGDTKDEADKAFRELLEGHFQFQIEHNLLDKDMKRLGWTKSAVHAKKHSCVPPFFTLFPNFPIPPKGRVVDQKLSISVT